jgi:undecaprenyl-diphosphatase
MEAFEELDKLLFFFFNGLHTDFLDPVFFLISGKAIWIPFYMFFVFLLFKKFGKKMATVLTIGIILTVGATDFIAAKVIKPGVGRYRPSHNIDYSHQVHLLKNSNGDIYKGGKYSFVSNHAANSFALATFLAIYLRRRIKYFMPSILLWASIVSYSRIYLGVHYPADIVCGALFGMTMASIFSIITLMILKKYQITEHS